MLHTVLNIPLQFSKIKKHFCCLFLCLSPSPLFFFGLSGNLLACFLLDTYGCEQKSVPLLVLSGQRSTRYRIQMSPSLILSKALYCSIDSESVTMTALHDLMGRQMSLCLFNDAVIEPHTLRQQNSSISNPRRGKKKKKNDRPDINNNY